MRAKVFLALAVAIVAPACEEAPGCPPYIAAALSVTVQDDETGLDICDAIVTARDRAYSEVLHAPSDTPPCDYGGAIEREGTYTVRAERAGYSSKTVSNLVAESSGGDCPHVQTVRVTIRL